MQFEICVSCCISILNMISICTTILAASFDIVTQDKKLLYYCAFLFVLSFGVPANILARDFYLHYENYEATSNRRCGLIATFCWYILAIIGLVLINNFKQQYFSNATLETIWWNFVNIVCAIDFCYSFYLIRKLRNLEYYAKLQ